MKLLATFVLTALVLAVTLRNTSTATPIFDSCTCIADDGSCSASVTCPGGCLAYCPSRACRSQCLGGGGGKPQEPIYSMRVNLQLNKSNGKQIASELGRITAREVVFVPTNADATFSFDVKDAPLWNLLEMLSQDGSVRIGGEDFAQLQMIRRALTTGERMSVCIQNVPVKSLVKNLAELSGLNIRITSGDPKTLVSLSAREVTLDDIVAQVTAQTGVQVSVR